MLKILFKKLFLVICVLVFYEGDRDARIEFSQNTAGHERAFKKGKINQQEGRFEAALRDYESAISSLEYNGNSEDKLNCLKNLIVVSWCVGEVEKSLLFLNSALQINKNIPMEERDIFYESALKIISLYKKGKAYRDEGKEIDSLDCLDEAVVISKEIRSAEFELKCIRQKGMAHWQLNEAEDFRRCNEIGLSLAKSIRHKIEEGHCLNNMGIYYERIKDYTKALKYFTLASELARKSNDKSSESEYLNNIGLLYSEVGEYEKAINILKSSLRISQKNGNLKGIAITASNIGSVYLEKYAERMNKEDLNNAIRQFKLCIGSDTQKLSTNIKIAALNNLGIAYLELGEHSRAKECLSGASKVAQSDLYIEERGNIYINMGSLFFKNGNIKEATDHFNKSIELFSHLNAFASSWRGYYGLGMCCEKQHKMDEAIHYYETAIEHIEAIRERITIEFFRIGFLKNKTQVYQRLINALYIKYKSNKSYETLLRMLFVVEKAKAKAFIDTLLRTNRNKPEHLNNKYITRNSANLNAENRVRNISEQANEIDGAYPFKNSRNILKMNNSEYVSPHEMEFQTLVGSGFTNFSNFKQICNGLIKTDTVFLEYWLSEDKSFLFYYSNGRFQLYDLPSKMNLNASIRGYLKALSSFNNKSMSIDKANIRIASEVIGPIIDKLSTSVSTIIIVPDGILNYLPFETLLINGSSKHKYLIQRFKISYSPSMTMLFYLSKYWKKKKYDKKVLAIGAPVRRQSNLKKRVDDTFIINAIEESHAIYNYRFPGLPFSKKELLNVTKHFARTECDIYFGRKASKSKIEELNLNNYQIIHFACHGIINERDPLESALVLSNDQMLDGDGLLRMKEVYKLKLCAELVILSACNTAGGRLEFGAGIISISRSFFAAGARSVIASLWDVKDSAAVVFMDLVYRELSNGHGKSDAIRNAKIKMISLDYLDPYYWAGFILCGEYEEKVINDIY